jgi:chromosome segregation ATPase
MSNKYFPKMFGLMIASVAILVVTTYVVHIHPIASGLLAVLPLAYYHLKYLLPKAKSEEGLAQVAIDSVYYFGFLITVAALSLSALAVGFSGAAASVGTILLQFGTGLLATAYAVVARMHLQSEAVYMSDMSMEAVMDKYVTKSMSLVTNIEAASNQLAIFSQEIVAKTIDASEKVREVAEEKMLDAAEAFSGEISAALEGAKSGVHDLRVLLNNTAFVGERQQYVQSVKETVAVTVDLNKALIDLLAKIKEETSSMQSAVAASTNLGTCLNQFSLELKELAGPKGDLVQSGKSLSRANEVIASVQTTMSTTAASLRDFAATVKDTGPAFKSMHTLTKRTTEQLDALATASGRLGDAVDNVADAAEVSDDFANNLKKLAGIIPTLSASAETLSANIARAGNISQGFDAELAKLPRQIDVIESFGTRVMEAMQRISAETEQALSHSSQLAAYGEGAAKTIDGAHQLLRSADALQATVSSLQRLFAGLGQSVSSMQESLLATSDGMKLKLADSSKFLDDDIRRSSAAAADLTERLNEAMRSIAGYTNEVKPHLPPQPALPIQPTETV